MNLLLHFLVYSWSKLATKFDSTQLATHTLFHHLSLTLKAEEMIARRNNRLYTQVEAYWTIKFKISLTLVAYFFRQI